MVGRCEAREKGERRGKQEIGVRWRERKGEGEGENQGEGEKGGMVEKAKGRVKLM